jgi:gluconate kinase
LFLNRTYELILARLQEREHRCMPATPLANQFATLEPPRAAIDVDISRPPERCVDEISSAIVPTS